jgi:hypothetical protein
LKRAEAGQRPPGGPKADHNIPPWFNRHSHGKLIELILLMPCILLTLLPPAPKL